ncbi:bifunctional protein PutA [Shewanella sp. NFH-SH190041]|uniref:bifunctional proline dehydrogenase/L-glutamate gamma-semialdehyde dehydrogenase PutA n=1 Tax=Shewanella sp. NFH-SH190041 TaxID=2950245 RepID=UPI0021C29521|nr:bifunctional proline dehydrogenase/L-glutamate gamma-semialdehyde dehydrogenase PutA [Shewanella sp. NFH-SH190041]BDM65577.1 bifunctional protein PutA [Shewanella sp. NFH-SH190041]
MFEAKEVLSGHYQNATPAELFTLISPHYAIDEDHYLPQLMTLVPGSGRDIAQITQQAANLVNQVRNIDKKGLMVGIDAFLQQYSLETEEGIILMCLAEALLRIPDAATASALIEDKLSGASWDKHLKQSDSTLVNASTWGLMLTGKIVAPDKDMTGSPGTLLNRLLNKVGEPVIRNAMYGAMKIMGRQFVLGQDIQQALKNSECERSKGRCHSYDMLGEAALTAADAAKYYQDYAAAITAIGSQAYEDNAPRPTISIKLSALHPRYETAQQQRVITELYDKVCALITLARQHQVGISIDAEEADRLELSLTLFQQLYQSKAAKGWGQLGIVVQAYSKRALPVLVWLTALGRQQGDSIPVRLVKGAYWDSEIKWAQIRGDTGYPVFTRKAGTDISYLACARYLLSDATIDVIQPQFATHNAQTVTAINAMAGTRTIEFQRLHGMGQDLYDCFLANSTASALSSENVQHTENTPLSHNQTAHIRIYAPVGAHKDLLPYLVRRLLENGANTSFVHKLVDPATPVAGLVEHPLITLRQCATPANHNIPLPRDIFADRVNSAGINLAIHSQSAPLFTALDTFAKQQWQAHPLVFQSPPHYASYDSYAADTAGNPESRDNTKVPGDDDYPENNSQALWHSVLSPYDRSQLVGRVQYASADDVTQALSCAQQAFPRWRDTKVTQRAAMLQQLAILLEDHRDELIALCCLEAGKTLQDGIDEVREAVDFCRYYANHATSLMARPQVMPGPTGERNELSLHGRGVFVCISPWNFPLAIFLGQITAALATGNCVIAKPAEQTCLIGFRAVELAYQAGIPKDVLQFLPGTGTEVGAQLTTAAGIAGVCFTGSTLTAKAINSNLAQRDGAIIPLIAETGGQNAMIVDSTSLPEQVVTDVVASAFTSAGQRCSALRVLYLQEEIADQMITLLQGAMDELSLGNPCCYSTDIGPVISAQAQSQLYHHIERWQQNGGLIHQRPLPQHCSSGTFVPPTALSINSISELEQEQFGPVLHIVRYASDELDKVIADINATGFGLTLGIHSRNESHALALAAKLDVGNVYINRNQIGAVVGVQPFGGHGLSGTGPKAGGPLYLTRFVTEKTCSNNITAIGGNATLLSQTD